MSDTAAYLLNRQKELQGEISLLQEELKRVKIAYEAIMRMEPSSLNAELIKLSQPAYMSHGQNSIKEMILEVLSEAPRGMKAIDILESINSVYTGINLARTSLSPQLSRLKNEREIVKRGLFWVHKKHAEPIIGWS